MADMLGQWNEQSSLPTESSSKHHSRQRSRQETWSEARIKHCWISICIWGKGDGTIHQEIRGFKKKQKNRASGDQNRQKV